MELYQLRTFLAIARTGNLTRASTILKTSQPAVSAQLKALEDELGVALFSRTSRGMELTAQGKLLRAKAEEVDTRAAELLALAGSLSGKVAGTCRIGLNTEAEVLRVPALVDALSITAPQLGVELLQGVTRQILDDVAAGALDGGFVFGQQAMTGLRTMPLARLELVVAAPVSWSARLRGAPLARLLEEPWVTPPEECPFHEGTIALFRSAGGHAPRGVTADHEATILRLVCAGVGLSLLPAVMVERAAASGEAIAIRVPGATSDLSFAWHIRDDDSPTLRPVREALRAIWGQ